MILSVLSLILKFILPAIIAFVAIGSLKLLISYKELDFYRKQGIKTYFYPMFGFMTLYMKEKGSHNQIGRLFKLFEENKHKKAFVVNGLKFTKSFVFIVDPNLLQELFSVEIKYLHKLELNLYKLGDNFFNSSGCHALKRRVSFSEFFRQENLKFITPKIHKIIFNNMKNISKSERFQNNGFSYCDIHEMLTNCYSDVVDQILLGENQKICIDGRRLGEYLIATRDTIEKAKFHFLNFFLGGYPGQFECFPPNRDFIKMKEKLHECAGALYDQRLIDGPKNDLNVLDLIIKENSYLPESEKWSRDEITGNLILFQSAGVDTTLYTMASFMSYLATDPNLQKNIRDNLSHLRSEDVEEANFDKNEWVDSLLKEILRLYGSGPISMFRRVAKTFTVKSCNFTLRKGDIVQLPFTIRATDPEVVKDAKKFIPGRFMGDKKVSDNKLDNIPFSSGQRNCVGQYMARMMIKSTLASLTEFFQLELKPGFVNEFAVGSVYGIKELELGVKVVQK